MAKRVTSTTLRTAIVKALAWRGEEPLSLTPTQIATAAGMSRLSVQKALPSLVDANLIQRRGARGYYALTDFAHKATQGVSKFIVKDGSILVRKPEHPKLPKLRMKDVIQDDAANIRKDVNSAYPSRLTDESTLRAESLAESMMRDTSGLSAFAMAAKLADRTDISSRAMHCSGTIMRVADFVSRSGNEALKTEMRVLLGTIHGQLGDFALRILGVKQTKAESNGQYGRG